MRPKRFEKKVSKLKDRRLIEENFPVKEVSAESSKEKSIRHGHISTLHIWWARRPLASSRATNYAALVPAPRDAEEWNRKRDFIISLCKWENSLDQTILEKARGDILQAYGGRPPRILDPFAGGGAIPLEALRLGCEVYSSDYNPVSVLIQKCTLEYPQKYGKSSKGKAEWAGMKDAAGQNPLLGDVRKWGKWVLEEATKEISRFYPNEPDGSIPVGYVWARTVTCQNPACGSEIPLMRQLWLAKTSAKQVALYPFVENRRVRFEIVGSGSKKFPAGFAPDNGTVSRAIATCLVCGSVIDGDTTRKLFHDGKASQRIVAVVLHNPESQGKSYRTSTERDLHDFEEAARYLTKKREELLPEWGIDPVPDELLPPKETLGFRVQRYGILRWGDLFNARQNLALITFCDKVRQAHSKILEGAGDEEYAKAVVAFLGMAVDRLSDYDSSITRWVPHGEFVGLEHISQSSLQPAHVTQSSSTSLPYPNDYFDAVLTDPPYYDNVPYSYLSDFFYVWLKRSLGNALPEVFSTPLTPKASEIVAYSDIDGGWEAAKEFFEESLRRSFREINRVLKPDGISVVVYAHKSTEGWETLINSLLDSGLIATGAWPINTEMQTRMRAKESAALASSIYIVTRKMQRESTGFYNQVRDELRKHLDGKLDRLWKEGISGADFFISAIGSAIEVFGRYEKVMDYEGNLIRADRLLDDVREIVTDYAVRQILHNGFGSEISDLTRLYVLWRWEFGETIVPFDDARKLAQSCGVDLAQEWNRHGFVKKEKEFVRLLGPEERSIEDLASSRELVDILHFTLLLWEKGKRDDIASILSESGFGRSEAFFRVAQAVSETLPTESKEKKLLDGFLAGRERLREEVRRKSVQKRLI